MSPWNFLTYALITPGVGASAVGSGLMFTGQRGQSNNITIDGFDNNDQSINASDFEVPDAMPADPDVDTTLSHKRIFTQSTGTKTYYINAKMVTGAGAPEMAQSGSLSPLPVTVQTTR